MVIYLFNTKTRRHVVVMCNLCNFEKLSRQINEGKHPRTII